MNKLITIFVLVSLAIFVNNVDAVNLFGMFGKKEYTPLVFFKVPKGTSPECDEMEKVITSVEKELKTKVQRYDILRDRFARNLYEKIDEIEFVGKVPMLYHRESRQIVYGLDTKARVKAWAKGRWLSPKMKDDRGDTKKFVPDEDDQNLEQIDGYMEEELTELQQSGREKMIERLEEDRK